MAFDASKPNLSQTYGDAIASANANDNDLNNRLENHKGDASAHGLAAIIANVADLLLHKANSSDAHGINTITANVAALLAEIAAGRGAKPSLTGRLDAALNGDGSIRLSTLNNKWINNGDVPTFISTNSFSVPGDRTALYIGGVQLRFTVAGSYVYAPVASRAFGGGVTTVVLDPAYAVLNAGIQAVDLALIAWDNTVAQACTSNATNIASVQGQVSGLKQEQIEDWIAGKPAAGAVVKRFIAARGFSLPAGISGAIAKAATAATATASFTLAKNGVPFGTMSFAAAGSVPTFAAATASSFAAGDVLTIIAPASQDATLADIAYYLPGVLP